MLKQFALPALVLAVMFRTAAAKAGDVVFLDDLRAAKEQAARDGKLILVDFMASWCTNCKMMEEYTFSNDQVAGLLQRNYLVVKVNIDNFDGFDLKQQYKVHTLPTLLFLDSKGRLLEKREESMVPSKMIERLEAHNQSKNKIAAGPLLASAETTQPTPRAGLTLTPAAAANPAPAKMIPVAYVRTVKPPAQYMSNRPTPSAVRRDRTSPDISGGLPIGSEARASATPASGFTIQVGSFAEKTMMSDFVDRIRRATSQKVFAFVARDARSALSYKLLVGSFDSRQAAAQYSRSLTAKGISCFVRDFASLHTKS